MTAPIQAVTAWSSNAELIADVARLGHLQGGRRRSVEGSALPVALRRAVRAARGVSGDVKAKGQVG